MKAGRHIATLLLVVIALGVAAWAYLDAPSLTETERKMRPSNVFNPWRVQDLTRVEIKRGADALVFVRDAREGGADASWRMISPRAEKTDPAAVDRLLAALEYASIVRKVDGAGVGFDPPRAVGTLTMGQVTHRFELGGAAPTPEGASYLRQADRVVVVSRDLTTQLMLPADAYRERTIVPYLSIQLSRMEVTSAAGRWEIAREDEIGFRLTGSGFRASRDALDKVWGALAEMRAEAFLPDEAGDAAVARPRVRVVMTPKDEAKPQGEIVVGDACPGSAQGVVVARTKPTRLVVCAPKVVVDGLSVGHDALVDAHALQARADEIAELELRASPSGEVLDLARRGSGWHMRAPADRDLTKDEAEVAGELASALARIEGKTVERAPLGALAGRVRVRRVDGVEEVVDVEAPLEGVDYVRAARRFDGARFFLDRAAWRKLQPRASSLRGRDVWPVAIAGRAATRVDVACAGRRQEAVVRAGVWALVQPAGYAADRESLVSLVDALQRARAEVWVADADDGSFGFRSPGDGPDASPCIVELVVEREGGVTPVRIQFGDEGEGGVYARTAHDPAVFVAPRSLRDLATRILVDRHGFAVERALVTKVTLARRGARPVVYRAVGGKLVGAEADKVLAALEGLFADRVLDLTATPTDKPELTIEIEMRQPAGTAVRRIAVGPTATTPEGSMRLARLDDVKADFLVKADRLAPFFEAK